MNSSPFLFPSSARRFGLWNFYTYFSSSDVQLVVHKHKKMEYPPTKFYPPSIGDHGICGFTPAWSPWYALRACDSKIVSESLIHSHKTFHKTLGFGALYPAYYRCLDHVRAGKRYPASMGWQYACHPGHY